MTIENTSVIAGPFTGTGLLSAYDFDFKIFDETQIQVYETNTAGAQTLLTLTTHYTVTFDTDAETGTVTRVAGNLPAGYQWYIRGNYDIKQSTDFTGQGAFLPVIHENAFDGIVLMIQQAYDLISRSVGFAPGYSGLLDITFPSPVANQFIRWNSNATGLENANIDITSQVTAATNAAITATTQASAASASAAAAAASAATAAGDLIGTSTTSLTIGTGTKVFTTQANDKYVVGAWVLAVSAANSANYMIGRVTGYVTTALTVDVTLTGGSGTLADWNLTVTGSPGATGAGITAQAVGFTASGGTSSRTLTVDANILVSDIIAGVYGGTTLTKSVQTGSFSASGNNLYFVDVTAGPVTVTLPGSPTLSTGQVKIIHIAGNIATNNITIARNGQNIMSLAENMTVSVTNATVTLHFANTATGWRLDQL
jgi:hypothetical protein